jgi:glutamate synthase domain-containing protein 3
VHVYRGGRVGLRVCVRGRFVIVGVCGRYFWDCKYMLGDRFVIVAVCGG